MTGIRDSYTQFSTGLFHIVHRFLHSTPCVKPPKNGVIRHVTKNLHSFLKNCGVIFICYTVALAENTRRPSQTAST